VVNTRKHVKYVFSKNMHLNGDEGDGSIENTFLTLFVFKSSMVVWKDQKYCSDEKSVI
jgi:hypothetical protein